MPKPIVNIADLPMEERRAGSRFGGMHGRIGPITGMKDLGAQYSVVPPGKTAYPKHAHHNNEEMFVILDGQGRYLQGNESWDVRTGDVIAAPAGDASTAHQLFNTGAVDLRYLSISTRNPFDLVEYPDSGKYYVAVGIPEQKMMMDAPFKIRGREMTFLDYYDGEDIGEEEATR